MFSLYKKEIAAFFCSATGYLAVAVFLIATGLFLWVIPNDLNILYGGYATLDPLFAIAPWIFLFLVPAISMRLIAEERKSGTLELLIIRPLSTLRIAMAKYLAGLTLVALSVLPTVTYVAIVWYLGAPEGNLDIGGTLGSYLGLIALGATYMAIGLFASSITDNQIVAFVTAVALCFGLFYFGTVGTIPALKSLSGLADAVGIESHYASISRGVLDSRDMVYFLSAVALFVALTCKQIRHDSTLVRRILQFCAVGAAIIAANIASVENFFRIDLTTEKRFTLASVTANKLAELTSPVNVTLYLDGDLNPGFARLRRATREMIDEFDIKAKRGVDCQTVNVLELSKAEQKEINEELAALGLGGVPVFESKEDGQKTRSIVYPYARVSFRGKHTIVNLLENMPGLSGDENLNRSVENIEYKLIDAVRMLSTDERDRIAFIEGHGELDEIDVVEAVDALSAHFAVDRGQIGTDATVLDKYKAIIIAKPSRAFAEGEKYIIDQYIMNGGRVMWLVDAVTMTLDSLRQSPHTIGLLADFNINDQLFIYGIRVNPEVVEDINCGMVPISVANSTGDGTQIVPMPWRFSPLLSTNKLSPITKNVNLVKGDFSSYIDTVGENLQIRRTPLLKTSKYTKVNQTPVFATLATIHEQPQQSDFRHQNLDVAMLQEGVFASAFAHRKTPAGVQNARPTKQYSQNTKMIVVADGDIIRNDVRFRNSQQPNIIPLGYDELSRQTFGNKDFIVNSLLYLTDDDGWMQLRTRTFTLRMLDREKIMRGTTELKAIALAVPIIIIFAFGITVVLIRRAKFGKHYRKSE